MRPAASNLGLCRKHKFRLGSLSCSDGDQAKARAAAGKLRCIAGAEAADGRRALSLESLRSPRRLSAAARALPQPT
jgi:hypothetical protein